MTIETATARVSYVGDGTSVAFPITFEFYAPSDIAVWLGGIQILTGFTISGGNDAEGTCTFNQPPGNGLSVTLILDPPITQLSEFVDGTDFPSATVEQAYDRSIMVSKRLLDRISRSIRVPDSDVSPQMLLPPGSTRANFGLGFDASGNISLVTLLATALNQSVFNTFLGLSEPYALTPAEIAAGISSVADPGKRPGNVLRYVINSAPGVTDMSGAFNAAIAQAGNGGARVRAPGGNYYIASSCVIGYSNIEVYLGAGAVVNAGTNQISHFSIIGQNNIKFTGKGSLLGAAPLDAGTPHLGGIYLGDGTTNVDVNGLNFIGMQYCGVHGQGASYNKVRHCTMMNFFGTIVDAAGVSFLSTNANDAVGNEVYGNRMVATGEHGVLIQDPYCLGHVPRDNKVHHNKITGTTGYGVAVYIPSVRATCTGSISSTTFSVSALTGGAIAVGQQVVDVNTGVVYANIAAGSGTSWTLDASATVAAGTALYCCFPQDTDNEITSNRIDGVLGTGQAQGPNLSSGNGIYGVGCGAGGLIITNNQVTNCCISTGNASEVPAGIGVGAIIGNTNAPVTGPLISNNKISGMTQGSGVAVSGCSGAVVGPNQISIPASNNGSGPGGGALIGHGVFVVNSNGTSVIPGRLDVLGAGSSVFFFANGQNQADCSLSAGRCRSNGGVTVRVDQQGGFSNTNFAIAAGVRATNSGTTASSYALQIVASPGIRVGVGVYTTGGTIAIVTSGTCTGGFIDTPYYGGGTGSLVSNAGSGINISIRNNAAPSAGTWNQGDICFATTPASGGSGVSFWQVTTGGASPTWTPQTLN